MSIVNVVAVGSGTRSDLVIVMLPHCVILVWAIVWCFLMFIIQILVLLDAFI